VAVSGNTYQEKEKISVLTEAEREKLLGEFRSYLEADRRAPHLVHEYAASIGIFLLRGHDPYRLDRRELEARYHAVYPGRELVGTRRTALVAFLSFLRGVHDGVRRLPPLPKEWEPLLEHLRSGCRARGLGTSSVEYMYGSFSQFCRWQVSQGFKVKDIGWEGVEGFRAFLSEGYLFQGAPLSPGGLAEKIAYVLRSLGMLQEDGVLVHLPPRRVYVRLVASHVVPGLRPGYRVLVAAFRDYLETIGMAQTCQRSYPQMVVKFLAWLEGTGIRDVREVDERVLLAYRSGPGRTIRDGEEASPRTRIAVECALKKFFTFLYRTRRIHADPSAHMEYTRSPRSLPRAMPEVAEVEAMLSLIDVRVPVGARDLAVLEMLYGTGLRSSEIRGLTLAHVQLDVQLLFVRGKGGKEALVPFGDRVARALALYMGFARPCLARRSAGKDKDAVFLSEYGKPLTGQCLANIVHRRSKAAGIERNLVPHSFRHACATHMLRNGADLRVVQQLLRHERIDTTLIYTRLLTSDVREAQRKFHPRERD
jgi:integrase/recombinase XerD